MKAFVQRFEEKILGVSAGLIGFAFEVHCGCSAMSAAQVPGLTTIPFNEA